MTNGTLGDLVAVAVEYAGPAWGWCYISLAWWLRFFGAGLFCLLISAPALAQSTPVLVGQPVTVAWDASVAEEGITAYRCYLDKVKVGMDIPVSQRTCTTSNVTVGVHVIEVSAVNVFGEGQKASVGAAAGTTPVAPTNLRIVVQIAVQPSANVTLLTASVTRDP